MAVSTRVTTDRRAGLPPGVVPIGLLVVFGGLLAAGVKSGVCDQHLSTWVRLSTTGLTLGSIYAMIALGYTMVYGVLQLINFAHSEVFMIGTFAGVWMLRLYGIHSPVSGIELPLMIAAIMVPSMAISGAAAVALERVAYRPLRRRGAPRLAFLITAIGASIFLSNLFFIRIPIVGWTLGGAAPVQYPELIHRTALFTAFGYQISNKQILVVVTMLLMYLFLDRFVTHSRAGK